MLESEDTTRRRLEEARAQLEARLALRDREKAELAQQVEARDRELREIDGKSAEWEHAANHWKALVDELRPKLEAAERRAETVGGNYRQAANDYAVACREVDKQRNQLEGQRKRIEVLEQTRAADTRERSATFARQQKVIESQQGIITRERAAREIAQANYDKSSKERDEWQKAARTGEAKIKERGKEIDDLIAKLSKHRLMAKSSSKVVAERDEWRERASVGEGRANLAEQKLRESDPLSGIVERFRAWRRRNFDLTDRAVLIRRVIQEAEELRRAHDGEADSIDEVNEEVADVILMAMAVLIDAGQRPIQIINRKLEILERRDYRRWPNTGEEEKERAALEEGRPDWRQEVDPDPKARPTTEFFGVDPRIDPRTEQRIVQRRSFDELPALVWAGDIVGVLVGATLGDLKVLRVAIFGGVPADPRRLHWKLDSGGLACGAVAIEDGHDETSWGVHQEFADCEGCSAARPAPSTHDSDGAFIHPLNGNVPPETPATPPPDSYDIGGEIKLMATDPLSRFVSSGKVKLAVGSDGFVRPVDRGIAEVEIGAIFDRLHEPSILGERIGLNDPRPRVELTGNHHRALDEARKRSVDPEPERQAVVGLLLVEIHGVDSLDVVKCPGCNALMLAEDERCERCKDSPTPFLSGIGDVADCADCGTIYQANHDCPKCFE